MSAWWLVLFLAAAAGSAAAWLWLQRPPCMKRRVLVNIKWDEQVVFRGILWRARGPWMVLRDVTIINADGSQRTMDGETLLHRSSVAFLQVISE